MILFGCLKGNKPKLLTLPLLLLHLMVRDQDKEKNWFVARSQYSENAAPRNSQRDESWMQL